MRTLVAFVAITASEICFVQGQNTTLEISTPKNVTQCMYTEISWVGGTAAPFVLQIARDLVAEGMGLMHDQSYPDLTHSPVQWLTNLRANTTLKLLMYDADISMPSVSSDDFIVQDSDDVSCLTVSGVLLSSSTMITYSPTSATLAFQLTTPTPDASTSFTSGSSTVETAPHAAPVPQTTSDVRHHLPNGAIGGMIAGGVLLLVASAAVLLMRTKWLRRWNKFTAPRSQRPSTGDHNQDETNGSDSLSNACSPAIWDSKNQRTQDHTALESVVSTSESAPQPPEEIVDTVRSDPAATPARNIEPAEHHDRDVGVVHGNRPLLVDPTSLVGIVERITRAVLSESHSVGRRYEEELPPRYEE